MKNVIAIGGSLFTGRVFSIQASKSGAFNLHVVNRGNFPMELERVTQYKCNRHSPRMMARLIPDVTYDALVDFCAYDPGDVKSVIDALGGRVKQYILFSTASVYAPSETFLDENSPIADVSNAENTPALDYVAKKIELERELAAACDSAGIKYTILRPAFIYGPFNYAPRESFFIEMIAKKYAVPVPIGAEARFNFVYVLDVAEALMRIIGEKKAYGATFNLAGEEAITYTRLIADFERFNNGPFETREVTVAQVEKENIQLPFPLTENTLYDGSLISRTFDFNYTPFAEGMERTFKIFYSIYTT
ncbi:MAG: NAD-dependent epimerase/dehydratase family protein [Oscillospiraceae bacterium]|nr:NAD-dependent epimerase/dehydratase family protein [Oscillospiraceae bacterium]